MDRKLANNLLARTMCSMYNTDEFSLQKPNVHKMYVVEEHLRGFVDSGALVLVVARTMVDRSIIQTKDLWRNKFTFCLFIENTPLTHIPSLSTCIYLSNPYPFPVYLYLSCSLSIYLSIYISANIRRFLETEKQRNRETEKQKNRETEKQRNREQRKHETISPILS